MYCTVDVHKSKQKIILWPWGIYPGIRSTGAINEQIYSPAKLSWQSLLDQNYCDTEKNLCSENFHSYISFIVGLRKPTGSSRSARDIEKQLARCLLNKSLGLLF